MNVYNRCWCTEKELVREVESLRYLKRTPSGGQRTTTKTTTSTTPGSKLDSYIKNLESERDFLRRETETLQELLKTSSSSSPSCRESRLSTTSGGVRTKSTSPGKQSSTVSRCSVCACARRRSQSPGAQQQQQQQAIEEIKKLKREKDELKGLLDKFEGYMDQVRALYNV